MTKETKFACPVCGYTKLDEPAYDANHCASYGICPCCGTEFGYDDHVKTHISLRKNWIQNGMKWWSQEINSPLEWNGSDQLCNAGFDFQYSERDETNDSGN